MKVIVLGGGSDQCSLISYLKELGATVVLVDYYANPPAKALADRHYQISTLDPAAVLALAQTETPTHVLTACIDQALLTAAWVSEELGLPFYLSHQTALKVSNKAHMKEVFASHQIPTPKTLAVTPEGGVPDLSSLTYPLVVKPADANGSFGVTKVARPDEALDAVKRAVDISRSRTAVIDEFVPGEEISVDAYVSDGNVTVLLHTRSSKLGISDSCFPIHRSYFPSGLRSSEVHEVGDIACRIARAFGLLNTPLIIQLINGPDGLRVLEFGARIAGGSKHHLIKRLTGCDIMQTFVKMALGEQAEIRMRPAMECAATTYIYGRPGTFQELRQAEALVQENIIDEFYLYKTPGMQIEGFGASRDRVGAFISTAPTTEELLQKLAVAERTLQVINTDGDDIMLRGTHRGRQQDVCVVS